MLLPAKNHQTGEVVVLKSDDVLFIQTEQDKVIIHTLSGEYCPVKTLSDYTQLLKEEGFDKLDKSNVVNLKRISTFDSCAKTAHFETTDEHSSEKKVNVSRRNLFKVKRLKTVRRR